MIHPDETRRTGRWVWWLALLVNLLVHTGSLSSFDTQGRYKVTHSWWTSSPEATPPIAVFDPQGRPRAWWGPGQSALMFPADLIGTAIASRFGSENVREHIRTGWVSVVTFPLMNATTVWLVFLLLGELGFSKRASVMGAVALLLGSSFLKFCQDHQENTLLDFLTVSGAYCLVVWRRTDVSRHLWTGMLLLASGLLVRLPQLAPVAAVMGPVAWALLRRPDARHRLFHFCVAAAVCLGLAVLVDRWYQYHRFGSWTGTYISVLAAQLRRDGFTLSKDWPFGGDFWDGFLGPLITPQRGFWAYDPLILLAILLPWGWRRLPGIAAGLLLAGGAAFLGQVLFHARCDFWDGGGNWANRYTLVPIHFVLPLIVAAVCDFGPKPNRSVRGALGVLCAWSLTVQVASVIYPDSLESFVPGVHVKPFALGLQFDHPVFLVGKRMGFIVDQLQGRMLTDPAGIIFHRVCLWPANVARDYSRVALPAWSLWTLLAMAAASVGWRVRAEMRRGSERNPQSAVGGRD